MPQTITFSVDDIGKSPDVKPGSITFSVGDIDSANPSQAILDAQKKKFPTKAEGGNPDQPWYAKLFKDAVEATINRSAFRG